jgi:hypothetical protein
MKLVHPNDKLLLVVDWNPTAGRRMLNREFAFR